MTVGGVGEEQWEGDKNCTAIHNIIGLPEYFNFDNGSIISVLFQLIKTKHLFFFVQFFT